MTAEKSQSRILIVWYVYMFYSLDKLLTVNQLYYPCLHYTYNCII